MEGAVAAQASHAEAVNYALSQLAELSVFCSDGAVSIDNNVSEREMKRVVLNRKNSLFVGNPRGGRTAAILASLTSTCRRHEIDPQLYLTQLLTNLSRVRKANCKTGSPTSGSGFSRHASLQAPALHIALTRSRLRIAPNEKPIGGAGIH